MPASILVTYATTYGSTQEVAEAIAATLCEGGLEVDLQPMRRVRALNQYRAVVLGAPLYLFRWHKDARHFVAQHQAALADLPTAVFALGPLPGTDEKGWQDCRAQLDKELGQFPWLKPIAIELFGGRYDPSALRFPYTLLPAMKKIPAGDIRDWTKIRAWASALAARLQPSISPAS
jgi:menaquinone-dependent protoporphyrinogen oxidase